MFLVLGVARAEEVLLENVIWQRAEELESHLAQVDDIVFRPRLDRVEVKPRSAGAARICPDMGLEGINSRFGRRSASLDLRLVRCR